MRSVSALLGRVLGLDAEHQRPGRASQALMPGRAATGVLLDRQGRARQHPGPGVGQGRSS